MKSRMPTLLRLLFLAVIVQGFALTQNSHAFISDATQVVSTSIHGQPFEGSADPIVGIPTERFSATLSFNKFDPSLADLQRVEIQFRSIVDGYQYTAAACGTVEDCIVRYI